MKARSKARVAVPAAILFYEAVIRPWQEHWGATEAESVEILRGDHLVAEPAHQVTRAITIDAAPEEVWPWIAQLGADRGGFYSYDWLEDRFGLDIHNAGDIHPEWQDVAVGDVVYANRARTAGWYVVDLVPGEILVLAVADLLRDRPVRRDEGLRWEFLWTFAVRPVGQRRTRLVVRERVAFGSRAAKWLMAPMGLVSFVMSRKMMQGIKGRVEGLADAQAREVSGRLDLVS